MRRMLDSFIPFLVGLAMGIMGTLLPINSEQAAMRTVLNVHERAISESSNEIHKTLEAVQALQVTVSVLQDEIRSLEKR